MKTSNLQLSILFIFTLTLHPKLSYCLTIPGPLDRLLGILSLKSPSSGDTGIPIIGSLTSLGNGAPPSFLQTTNPSPECVNISNGMNNGAHLCCMATVNGGNSLVQNLAAAADYSLNPNAVNGIECYRSTDGNTCETGEANLCCQVAGVLLEPPYGGNNVVSMWCACADDSLNPPDALIGVCKAP